MHRRSIMGLIWVGLVVLLTACDLVATPRRSPEATPSATQAVPPTPSVDVLRVNGTAPDSARLRITVPTVQLLDDVPHAGAQLLVVLADPQGTYSYLLTPANRAGITERQFNLADYPLEISLREATDTIVLWLVVVENRDYRTAEAFGLEALAASLGFGFRNWLAEGDPLDDPLAAVISASEGALYNWFAAIDVLGQTTVPLQRDQDWNAGLASQQSPDGGLSVVFTVRHVTQEDVAQYPTPTPRADRSGYVLRLDETFDGAESSVIWFEGQDETYINEIVDGAYQIQLSAIVQRDFGLSWGSIENAIFEDYIAEAEVQLLQDGVEEARYGLWFNYQDDYNFTYFGISNQGEYRAAVIQRNSNRIELQDWTPHPAIRRGAATNILTIESDANGDITLGINGEQLAHFNNQVFTNGSLAFFCYAESVPATCRLNRLRVWEREN